MLQPLHTSSDMAVEQVHAPHPVQFPLLLDGYQPHTFEYTANRSEPGKPTLADWLEVFRKSIPQFQRMALSDPDAPDQSRQEAVHRFTDAYEALLQRIAADPTASLPGFEPEPVNCISLSALRDRCLRAEGFQDAFRTVKAEENAKALALLPTVVGGLDAISDPRRRMEAALRGVFAGNIFDLGAAASSQLFNAAGGVPFQQTVEGLVGRPWAVDNLDAAMDALTRPQPHTHAIVFVDNAGSDAVIGILPFTRELVRRGTRVSLAANETPSINDITAAELQQVVKEAAAVDGTLQHALAEGTLQVVSTGTDMCVIDLRQVSPEVEAVAQDADLVVLEGMGRSIETNLNARFRVDALKLGMIKHPEVAAELGGRLYDIVCKFDPAP